MKPVPLSRIDVAVRQTVPVAMTLALAVLGAVPFRVPALAAIVPALPLVAVCYWTLHRPELMPAAAAFAVGLLIDLLSGAPLGVNAGVLVLVHLAISTQTRFFASRSFAIVWVAVSVVIGLALALAWLLACLYHATLIDPTALLFEALFTAGCLPLLWWLMRQCQSLVPSRA
jgi:rod shape-determining protein MreD